MIQKSSFRVSRDHPIIVELTNSIPWEMVNKAKQLDEGQVLIVYLDNGRVRLETEKGITPYVWRQGKWKAMQSKQKALL